MDTKRLVIALTLSAAVLILWTLSFPPPSRAPRAARPVAAARPRRRRRRPRRRPLRRRRPPWRRPGARGAGRAESRSGRRRSRRLRVAGSRSSPLYTATPHEPGGESWSRSRCEAYKDGARRSRSTSSGRVRRFPGVTLTLDPADPFLPRAGAGPLHRRNARPGRTRPDASASATARPTETGSSGRTSFGSGYVISMRVEREGPPAARSESSSGPESGIPPPEELKSRYTRPGSTRHPLRDGLGHAEGQGRR